MPTVEWAVKVVGCRNTSGRDAGPHCERFETQEIRFRARSRIVRKLSAFGPISTGMEAHWERCASPQKAFHSMSAAKRARLTPATGAMKRSNSSRSASRTSHSHVWRDREYIFDRVPKSLAVEIYPLWAAKLDQRFVAGFSVSESSPEWKGGAKLKRGLSGTLGTLTLEKDRIIFDAGERSGSRSWRLIDIENVSRTGSLDLTVTTSEKSGWFRGGMRHGPGWREPRPRSRRMRCRSFAATRAVRRSISRVLVRLVRLVRLEGGEHS
jgi:hypothetical protein